MIKRITENWLALFSLIGSVLALIWGVSGAYSDIRNQLGDLQTSQAEYNKTVKSIDTRLSRIEGRLKLSGDDNE